MTTTPEHQDSNDFGVRAIVSNDSEARGIEIRTGRILVTDGARSDTQEILVIF